MEQAQRQLERPRNIAHKAAYIRRRDKRPLSCRYLHGKHPFGMRLLGGLPSFLKVANIRQADVGRGLRFASRGLSA